MAAIVSVAHVSLISFDIFIKCQTTRARDVISSNLLLSLAINVEFKSEQITKTRVTFSAISFYLYSSARQFLQRNIVIWKRVFIFIVTSADFRQFICTQIIHFTGYKKTTSQCLCISCFK